MGKFANEEIKNVLVEDESVVSSGVNSLKGKSPSLKNTIFGAKKNVVELTEEEKKALKDRYVQEIIVPAIAAGKGAEFFTPAPRAGEPITVGNVGEPIIPSPEELKEFFDARDVVKKCQEERGV